MPVTSTTFDKIDDIFRCKLLLEDNIEFIIPLREDGYIHATALCKAVGKKPKDWLRIKETKDLIKKVEEKLVKSDEFESLSQNKTDNEPKKLIEIYKGFSC